MRYRDIRHTRPEPGAILPAFIVSVYQNGDMLLYSHGGFDIWCVYLATPSQSYDAPNEPYPFILDNIEIEQMTGTVTDFKGSFLQCATASFDFDAPEDVDYLQDMRDLGSKYGKDAAWSTFLDLYNCIPQEREISINREMIKTIERLEQKYPTEKNLRFTLDCLLCAMVAENNRLRRYGSKYDTKLGKKVKALGVYQAIFEDNLSIRQVADYSKGMPWHRISEECSKRGLRTPDM